MYSTHWGWQKCSEFPATRATDGWEPPGESWGSNSCPLQEQRMILLMEPPFQPRSVLLYGLEYFRCAYAHHSFLSVPRHWMPWLVLQLSSREQHCSKHCAASPSDALTWTEMTEVWATGLSSRKDSQVCWGIQPESEGQTSWAGFESWKSLSWPHTFSSQGFFEGPSKRKTCSLKKKD